LWRKEHTGILAIQAVANLAMMLEVFSAFLGGIRRIGDGVLHILAADCHFMFDFVDHGVLGFAGSARLAAGDRHNQSKNC